MSESKRVFLVVDQHNQIHCITLSSDYAFDRVSELQKKPGNKLGYKVTSYKLEGNE